MSNIDYHATSSWCRNEMDHAATSKGCYFDYRTAAHALYWLNSLTDIHPGTGKPQAKESIGTKPDPVATGPIVHNEQFLNRQTTHWATEAICQLYGWRKESKDQRWWKTPQRRFNQITVDCKDENEVSLFFAVNAAYMMYGDGEPGPSILLNGLQTDINLVVSTLNRVLQEDDVVPRKHGWRILSRDGHLLRYDDLNPQHGLNLSATLLFPGIPIIQEDLDRLSRAHRSRFEPILFSAHQQTHKPDHPNHLLISDHE